MAFKFPFTNYHELNLTWVLDQLKKLFEESAENVITIETYEGRLTEVETELPLVSETASDAAQNAAAASSLAQQAKSTADTARENAIQAQGASGQARQEAQAAQTAADAATQAAQQAQATAQNFDGRITQAENDSAAALEASRSFENRVHAAINTANNAASTATNAQGIATNANQNAAAALDKIGDLSALDTTAKQNLVAAINEVAQSGGGSGAVTSVNGKTGAVVLDASDIAYNSSSVESELNNIKEEFQIELNKPVSLGIGGLDNSGKTTTARNRARCGMFFSDKRCKTIFSADEGIEYRIATYRTSSPDTFIRYTTTNFIAGATEIPPETYLKILLRYADNPSATITDLTALQNSVHYTCYFENDKKILDGMKLSLLGDSISAYAGTIPEGYDAYYTGDNANVTNSDQMWWAVLSRQLNLTPLVINAYSGSGITQLEDSAHLSKIPMSSNERCAGLAQNGVNPDIIIIAGGLNDYSYALSAQSEPLPWDGKTAPVEGTSFTETYACMVKKLQTNYPNAVIVALSTWFSMRGTDNGYTLTHAVGNNVYTQRDYDEAIKFVSDQMHIAYIDINNIGFNRNNFYSNFAQDSATIPTHPNKFGQSVMGMYIANALPQIVSAFNYGRVIRAN